MIKIRLSIVVDLYLSCVLELTSFFFFFRKGDLDFTPNDEVYE